MATATPGPSPTERGQGSNARPHGCSSDSFPLSRSRNALDFLCRCEIDLRQSPPPGPLFAPSSGCQAPSSFCAAPVTISRTVPWSCSEAPSPSPPSLAPPARPVSAGLTPHAGGPRSPGPWAPGFCSPPRIVPSVLVGACIAMSQDSPRGDESVLKLTSGRVALVVNTLNPVLCPPPPRGRMVRGLLRQVASACPPAFLPSARG